MDRNRQPYRAADTADGGYSYRDLVGQFSGLRVVVGVLGKGHDHVGAVGNSGLPVRPYSFIQLIMDFMQTMPAFVFMIPVIAFFGSDKPAALVSTLIFGGTPVVRLTVLFLRSVPDSVREAVASFGANKWYLLTRVDLPLASPSIRVGIDQTITLSLTVVVVASLIGTKGLGEDVLEALQYANVGQAIPAGFAILFCAMVLDLIVQGQTK